MPEESIQKTNIRNSGNKLTRNKDLGRVTNWIIPMVGNY